MNYNGALQPQPAQFLIKSSLGPRDVRAGCIHLQSVIQHFGTTGIVCQEQNLLLQIFQ